MKKINFNSGDSNPHNDGIRLSIAMNPDSFSKIIIRNNEGSGLIDYLTDSDYIYNLSRISYFKKELKDVNSQYSEYKSYPSGLSWIPGGLVSSKSNSNFIDQEVRLPIGSFVSGEYVVTGSQETYSSVEEIATSGILLGKTISIPDVFEEEWTGGYQLEITDVSSPNDTHPFIEFDNNETGDAVISIFSSDLEGAIFDLEIKKDFTLDGSDNEQNLLSFPEKKIYPLYYGGIDYDESRFIEEWNSLFKINQNSNADSYFDDGDNRDDFFVYNIEQYINKNWNQSMRKFLWKDSIENIPHLLSTNEAIKLKQVIIYQMKNFGASEDLKSMMEYKEQKNRLGQQIEWHIGLGGKTKVGDHERHLKQEYTFIPPLNKSILITKVKGLPLRECFSANLRANQKLSEDMGVSYFENPKSKNGFFPLYLSKAMAKSRGNGSAAKYIIEDQTYYMPEGLIENITFFTGNYDPQKIIYTNVIEEESEEEFNMYGIQENTASYEASSEESDPEEISQENTQISSFNLGDYGNEQPPISI